MPHAVGRHTRPISPLPPLPPPPQAVLPIHSSVAVVSRPTKEFLLGDCRLLLFWETRPMSIVFPSFFRPLRFSSPPFFSPIRFSFTWWVSVRYFHGVWLGHWRGCRARLLVSGSGFIRDSDSTLPPLKRNFF